MTPIRAPRSLRDETLVVEDVEQRKAAGLHEVECEDRESNALFLRRFGPDQVTVDLEDPFGHEARARVQLYFQREQATGGLVKYVDAVGQACSDEGATAVREALEGRYDINPMKKL